MNQASHRMLPSDRFLDDILKIVGISADNLRAVVEPEYGDGNSYLVGSLASGLGNSASDVDVHVLRPELEKAGRPYLRQVENVPVDIEHLPLAWARDLAAKASGQLVDFEAGALSLGAPLDRTTQRRAARWLHSLPLRDSTPPVFDDEAARSVLAVLSRIALDRVLIMVALARLSRAAGLPTSAEDHLWQRAARGFLELRCRLAGDAATGDKWLPARAHRAGLTLRLFDRDEEIRAAFAGLGLGPLDAWNLVGVRPGLGAREMSLAGKRYLLNRHDRLLDEWSAEDSSLADALATHGPGRLHAAIRRAELDVYVDASLLKEELFTWTSAA